MAISDNEKKLREFERDIKRLQRENELQFEIGKEYKPKHAKKRPIYSRLLDLVSSAQKNKMKIEK